MDYLMHYSALIDNAKARESVNCYMEKHHIIPKCMGGTDDKSNLVKLTAREHFVAHQLLAMAYPSVKGLWYACRLMTASSSGQIRNNREYAWIKNKISEMPNGMQGKFHSPETRKKMSASQLGIRKSFVTRKKISNSLKGKSFLSEEGRKAISLKNTNKYVSEETKLKQSIGIRAANTVIKCPWCGKEGKRTGMLSWHFDRCKENPDGLQRQFHAKKS